jgi:hypothetical protein
MKFGCKTDAIYQRRLTLLLSNGRLPPQPPQPNQLPDAQDKNHFGLKGNEPAPSHGEV